MGKMTVIPACHRLNIYTLAVCSRQTKEKCLFVAKNGINIMFLLALTRYSSYISHEHIQKKKKTPQSSINYAKSCMTKTPHYMSRSFPIMAKVLVGLQSKRLRSFKRRWKECRKSVNNGWQGEKIDYWFRVSACITKDIAASNFFLYILLRWSVNTSFTLFMQKLYIRKTFYPS